MAQTRKKAAPYIPPAYDVQPVPAPSGAIRGVADWRQYRVTYEVQPDGRKKIVDCADPAAIGQFL